MNRAQLEHVIRAAAEISGDNEIVVIGASALLGQFPDAPKELRISLEADVFPKNNIKASNKIDGAIGELSGFHQQFGYYAHGIDEKTAVLPDGWKDRLVCVSSENTRGARGYCLEVHDLAVSKLIAGREKDKEFVAALLKHKLAKPKILEERSKFIPSAKRALVIQRLSSLMSERQKAGKKKS
jgi:hypothetical protein